MNRTVEFVINEKPSNIKGFYSIGQLLFDKLEFVELFSLYGFEWIPSLNVIQKLLETLHNFGRVDDGDAFAESAYELQIYFIIHIIYLQ